MGKGRKIVILGAGNVGATIAYTLTLEGMASEVVLIDINVDKAKGEAMDIAQGTPFFKPVNIYQGGYEDAKGAGIVIVTMGLARKPAMTGTTIIPYWISYRQSERTLPFPSGVRGRLYRSIHQPLQSGFGVKSCLRISSMTRVIPSSLRSSLSFFPLNCAIAYFAAGISAYSKPSGTDVPGGKSIPIQ